MSSVRCKAGLCTSKVHISIPAEDPVGKPAGEFEMPCTSSLTLCIGCIRQILAAMVCQVNSQLQTSNPDVYAAGDIAAFPLTMYGGKINRQEHVVNARSVMRSPLVSEA